MSVIIETSVGNLTVDLFVEDCPTTSLNFLKLCKIKYYNNCIFHNIQKNFIVQTGDPTASGRGGQSIFGLLYGEQAHYFPDEIKPHLRHKLVGTLSMANRGRNLNSSQFFITTAPDLDSLDDKHTIFGQVEEGFDTLSKINDALTDKDGKPYQVIRIRHTIILDDPFPDPKTLEVPSSSPTPVVDAPQGLLSEDTVIEIEQEKDPEKKEELRLKLEAKQAANHAMKLELLGDIPDAEIKPPDNVLFVCKLHPVTTEEDLELIFSRFGKIKSCDIIRDHVTNDSLCYGFIEYYEKKSAEEAYFKMNRVLIDDRRIHVDFSQSVAKVDWAKAGGWRNYFKNRARDLNQHKGQQKQQYKRPRREADYNIKGGGGGEGGGKNFEMLFDHTNGHNQDERSSKRHKQTATTTTKSNTAGSLVDTERKTKDKDKNKRRKNKESSKNDRDRDNNREGGVKDNKPGGTGGDQHGDGHRVRDRGRDREGRDDGQKQKHRETDREERDGTPNEKERATRNQEKDKLREKDRERQGERESGGGGGGENRGVRANNNKDEDRDNRDRDIRDNRDRDNRDIRDRDNRDNRDRDNRDINTDRGRDNRDRDIRDNRDINTDRGRDNRDRDIRDNRDRDNRDRDNRDRDNRDINTDRGRDNRDRDNRDFNTDRGRDRDNRDRDINTDRGRDNRDRDNVHRDRVRDRDRG